MADRYSWRPRYLRVGTGERLMFQERGGSSLDGIVAQSAPDAVAEEVASFFAFMKQMSRVIDESGRRAKDFAALNVAKGRCPEWP